MRRAGSIFVVVLATLVTLLTGATLYVEHAEWTGAIRTYDHDDPHPGPPFRLIRQTRLAGLGGYHVHPAVVSGGRARDFSADIPPATRRILVVGKSMVVGTPYVKYGSISDWVGAELSLRFPELHFEVINLAEGGHQSSWAYEMAKAAYKVNADLLLVAFGGDDETLGLRPAWRQRLDSWNLARLADQTYRRQCRPNLFPRIEMSPEYTRQFREIYEGQIADLARRAASAPFPTIFATVPINWKYDCHGGESGVEFSAEAAHIRQQAEQAEAAGDGTKAKALYRKLVETERCHRTRPSDNDFIRSLTRSPRVSVIDWEAIVDAVGPAGMADPTMFVDVSHMTWRAYALIGEATAQFLIDQKLLGLADEPLPPPSVEDIRAKYGWTEFPVGEPWQGQGYEN
ncbi:MAG: SGNH/GDSL hydrolase family protein [Deltaproteobacteria bacterium]|nr:SGNH/GDSL hydrolase family protein [Deltaproteobacteria bacterium]